MRGKPKGTNNGRTTYSLEDPYSVLDSSPGTPRYWQKKKFELIARLENLGPFNFFLHLAVLIKDGMKIFLHFFICIILDMYW